MNLVVFWQWKSEGWLIFKKRTCTILGNHFTPMDHDCYKSHTCLNVSYITALDWFLKLSLPTGILSSLTQLFRLWRRWRWGESCSFMWQPLASIIPAPGPAKQIYSYWVLPVSGSSTILRKPHQPEFAWIGNLKERVIVPHWHYFTSCIVKTRALEHDAHGLYIFSTSNKSCIPK